MSTPDPLKWTAEFIPRKIEMEQILDAWEQAKAGHPQLVVLIGESGLGKTRLLQEFYKYLRAHDDHKGYWPELPDAQAIGLRLNPDFPEGGAQGEIPWLWWAIRFSQSRPQDNPCGVVNAGAALVCHFGAFQAQELRNEASVKAIMETFGRGVGMVPWVGQLYGAFKWVKAMAGAVNQYCQPIAGVAETFETERQNAAAQASGLFFQLMQPPLDRDPTPIILVLDDCQWADQLTMEFVSNLLWDVTHATNRRLLILSTYWEADWNQDWNAARLGSDSLITLPTIINKLRSKQLLLPIPEQASMQERAKFPAVIPAQFRLLDIGHLPGEEIVNLVIRVLPGLTSDQLKLINERVGGNIEFCLQLLLLYQLTPDFFEGRDFRKPLSTDGLAYLHSSLPLGFNQVYRDRIQKLPGDVRRVLSWGSVQGIRFREDLLQQVASRLDESLAISQCVQQAQTPYAVSARVGLQLHEFRQRVYWEVAAEFLANVNAQKRQVKRALCETILEWIDHRLDQLDPNELEEFLLLARAQLTPLARVLHLTNDEIALMVDSLANESQPTEINGNELVNLVWLGKNLEPDLRARVKTNLSTVLGQLVRLLVSQRRLDEALGFSQNYVDAVSQSSWPEVEVPWDDQSLVAQILYEAGDPRAAQLVSLQLSQLKSVVQSSADPADKERLAGVLVLRAGLAKKAGEGTSIATYLEALQLLNEVVEAHEGTAETLRSMAAVVVMAAELQAAEGDSETALANYQIAHEIVLQMMQSVEDQPATLREEALVLEKIGDLHLSLGEPSEASSYYHRSHDLHSRISRGWAPTPLALREMAVADEKLGDSRAAAGDMRTALSFHLNSLNLRERILGEWGASSESLRDIAVALERVGDDMLQLGETESVEARFERSLELRRMILDRWGPSRESLRDIAIGLERRGMIQASAGRFEAALDSYIESMDIRKQILTTWTEDPQSLRDLGVAQGKVGDAVAALAQLNPRIAASLLTATRSYYEQSRESFLAVVERFGPTAPALADLAFSWSRIASLELALGHRREGIAAVRQSLTVGMRSVQLAPNERNMGMLQSFVDGAREIQSQMPPDMGLWQDFGNAHALLRFLGYGSS